MAPPPPLRTGPGAEQRPTRHRRRGARVRVIPLVLIAAIGGVLLWASRQDGGVSGKVQTAIDWVNHELDDVTGSGDIDAAIEYFNDEYARTGDYDRYSENELQALDVNLSGIEYQLCSPQHVVLRAFTARGTVSYLLVAGEEWGKAPGNQVCPSDLFDPSPWSVPVSEDAGSVG